MTDAEISRAVALAIGWPEHTVFVHESPEPGCQVWPVDGTWRDFDYRSPDVALPLLRWLMVEHAHTATFTRHWDGGEKVFCVSEPATGVYPWSDTLELAIARAVIAVGRG